jgi:hypothetical protein
MNDTVGKQIPGFLEGTEVARARRLSQPGFDGQLSLLEKDMELKKKLTIALLVVFGLFFAGMLIGAALGVFV